MTSKAWTGDYILDFAQLLESSTFGQDAGTLAAEEREHREADAVEEEEEEEDAPVFSSATGRYRHPKKYVQRGFKGEYFPFFSFLSFGLHAPFARTDQCVTGARVQMPTSSPRKRLHSRSATSLRPSRACSAPQQVRPPLPSSSA